MHGFAIVSAMFLLVALSVMGAFILTISTTQHVMSAQDIQGSRAQRAALAGLELGRYQVIVNGKCAVQAPSFKGSLAPFQVTVTCTPHGDANTTGSKIWSLTSTASTGIVASLGYVERTATSTFVR